jgi:tetratricopeptide (TPR) repeat protein
VVRLCLLFLGFAACFQSLAGEADQSAIFFQRAEKAYQTARARYHREPTNAEAAWQFGRACSDRADVSRHDKEKAALAQEGILACRQALLDNPKSAWAHYYLGIDLGQLASTRGLGALPELKEMEEEWAAAVRLDPDIDHAGPDRCLGLLYSQAPGWPLSVGSQAKAIQYLTSALRLAPTYPDNLLSLTEAHLKWNEYTPARGIAARIPTVFTQARKELAGPDWESSWVDWDRRWEAIQARLNESSRASSPHEAR